MSKIIRVAIDLIETLPQEIRDMILMKFSTKEILSIGRDKVGEHVWWKKCHETVDEAVRYGNLKLIKYLIELKYWTVARHFFLPYNAIIGGVDYINILLISIDNGHLHIIKYFIEDHSVNVNIDHSLLLHRSVDSCNLEIIKYFFENGADIEMYIDIFIYKLINSNMHISIEMLEYFVEKGADLSQYADEIYEHRAIHRNFEISNYFIDKNMVIDIIDCNDRITEYNDKIESTKKDLIGHDKYIHKCCSSGELLKIIHHLDVVTLKYFIDNSDDICDYIDNIFRVSVKVGNSEIVSYLIKQNLVDINEHTDLPLVNPCYIIIFQKDN